MMPGAVGRLFAVSTSGAWSISGAGEFPVDHLDDFRWHGDVALEGEFAYAGGGINVALQKPAFAVRVDGEMVSISNLKAGLWDGTLDVPRMQLHLPSGEKQLQFETQLILGGARSRSIIDSFSANRNQLGVAPLNWNGAWQVSASEKSRWITPRTSAGRATWRSMATSSMRAAKQT